MDITTMASTGMDDVKNFVFRSFTPNSGSGGELDYAPNFSPKSSPSKNRLDPSYYENEEDLDDYEDSDGDDGGDNDYDDNEEEEEQQEQQPENKRSNGSRSAKFPNSKGPGPHSQKGL